MQIYTFTISEFAIYPLPAYQVAKVITEVKLKPGIFKPNVWLKELKPKV